MRNYDNIKACLKATNGLIFNAKFIKKNGEFRDMTARIGVKSYLKGGSLKFNPEEHKLIVVFDMKKQEYRMIPVRTLLELKVNGKTYKFNQEVL